MKEIAVIANEKAYAEFLAKNLSEYLKLYANIHAYSLSEVAGMEFIKEEYVVVSAFTIFQYVKKKIRETSVLHVISIALNREHIEELWKLPKNSRVYLVNIDFRTCMQTITQIYEAGFRDLDMIPYFGEESGLDKTIKIAITPDEEGLLPPGMEKVVNIGPRLISLESVVDLADKMGIEGVFQSEEAKEARNKVYSSNGSIDKLLGENKTLSERMKALIELMEEGIILTDPIGKIYLSNEKAVQFLRKRTELLVDFNILELIPELKMINLKVMSRDSREEIIHVDGNYLMVTVTPIFVEDEMRGNIINLKNFDEIEEKQHGMRARIYEETHTAKYHFEDIKGESSVIRDCSVIAKRMAKSDSAVLITGESGTGKEVFAQSIHNASKREKYNFVAVNCAAIPENLLESEMFGYEEGAFTGARKGGKIGYFELAHKGTIFLDEIAEMPLLLQSKLLRVIEEKKIAKVGSRKSIDVDIRIIAATNKDLYELVEKREFREDLYYRLNVLPLEIPPLRERDQDVMILAFNFMEKLDCHFELSEETKKALSSHEWRGNIRELRNMIEYFSNLEKDMIETTDFPMWKRSQKKVSEGEGHDIKNINHTLEISEKNKLEERFLIQEGRKLDLYRFLLYELSCALTEKRRIGRSTLIKRAADAGKYFSEAELKSGLRKLDDYGFIHSEKGRGGSKITEKGISLYDRMNRLNW